MAALRAADCSVLDEPVRQSLVGHHRHLARSLGRAVTYQHGVATFAAVPQGAADSDWNELATLLGHGMLADMFFSAALPPDSWPPVFTIDGVQMIATELASGGPTLGSADELVDLDEAHLPEMLELVERSRPGPFWTRSIEMGPTSASAAEERSSR